jgi:hypothetical protein
MLMRGIERFFWVGEDRQVKRQKSRVTKKMQIGPSAKITKFGPASSNKDVWYLQLIRYNSLFHRI